MNPQLEFLLRAMSRLIYVVTDDEDHVIRDITTLLLEGGANPKRVPDLRVYNSAFGVVPAQQFLDDLKTKALSANQESKSPIQALEAFYKQKGGSPINFLILTDPEKLFEDTQCVRRILNVIHQTRADINKGVKGFICIGPRLAIPARLQPYMHVVRTGPPSDDEISGHLTKIAETRESPLPEGCVPWFRGLTHAEIESAIAHSIVKTRHDPGKLARRIDPQVVQDYRKERLNKTELLKVVEVDDCSFDKIGGLDRFKAWVAETGPSWTSEGAEYGLNPPSGVLCVGVWGCGKSMAVKALGSAWKLPVIALEIGKLRNSAVGRTEENTYRALDYIDAQGSCIVWVDEAEKEFAGSVSGQNDAGTMARTLSIISTWFEERRGRACLALTANSVQSLPIEITNRISERFFFDVPNTEDRIEILKIMLASVKTVTPAILQSFNLRELAEAAEEMVPREIEQAVEAAVRKSFVAKKPHLDFEIFKRVLQTKPRILKTMDLEVKAVLDWVGYDTGADDGVRARFASSKKNTRTMGILQGGV